MYGISYPYGKPEVADFLTQRLAPDAKIFDVGAGSGTYRNLLGTRHYEWSAIEIWEPAVEYLQTIYDHVYTGDIRTFVYPGTYDLIIFGDILEHLSVKDAQDVLATARAHSKSILVAVPYNYQQGPKYGNEAERHLQPDLTEAIFNERYPGFEPVYIIPNTYGYYYWHI